MNAPDTHAAPKRLSIMPLDQRANAPRPASETPVAPAPDLSRTVGLDEVTEPKGAPKGSPEDLDSRFGTVIQREATAREVRDKAAEIVGKAPATPSAKPGVKPDPEAAKKIEAKRKADAGELVKKVRSQVPDAVKKTIPPAPAPESKSYFQAFISWLKNIFSSPLKEKKMTPEQQKAADTKRIKEFFAKPERVKAALVKHSLMVKPETIITITEAGRLLKEIMPAVLSSNANESSGIKEGMKLENWDTIIGSEFSKRVNLVDALKEEIFGIPNKA